MERQQPRALRSTKRSRLNGRRDPGRRDPEEGDGSSVFDRSKHLHNGNLLQPVSEAAPGWTANSDAWSEAGSGRRSGSSMK